MRYQFFLFSVCFFLICCFYGCKTTGHKNTTPVYCVLSQEDLIQDPAYQTYLESDFSEKDKITYLLQLILYSDVTFMRNGMEYPAQMAYGFLQLKYRKKGQNVETAQEFINQIASESSTTGKPYRIKDEEGDIFYSREVLMKELLELEALMREKKDNSEEDAIVEEGS